MTQPKRATPNSFLPFVTLALSVYHKAFSSQLWFVVPIYWRINHQIVHCYYLQKIAAIKAFSTQFFLYKKNQWHSTRKV